MRIKSTCEVHSSSFSDTHTFPCTLSKVFTMSRGILVTGATGKQGGATVDDLISRPHSDFTILAVTRNPTSASANALAAKDKSIKIVKGDMNDVPSLFSAAKATHPNIWGVFSVQIPMGKGQSPESEERQGKALVDEAIKSGVKQFVYTSVDRHGEQSIHNPTHVPHFISKHNIEKHLIDQAKGTDMNYTILRPVAFMENFTPDLFGKLFSAAWRVGMPIDQPLQFVSTKDIGHVAAHAFRNPEAYRNRALSLAGDELTYAQLNQVFKDKTGKGVPTTFGFLGSGLLWGVKEMGTMMDFFRDTGLAADIPALRKEFPGLKNLGDWIEKDSAFARK